MSSSDSVVSLRTLGTTIGHHVTPRDDELTFSGADCDVVGSHEGRSSKCVNIKILDNAGFQSKRSAMANERKAGLTNNS